MLPRDSFVIIQDNSENVKGEFKFFLFLYKIIFLKVIKSTKKKYNFIMRIAEKTLIPV